MCRRTGLDSPCAVAAGRCGHIVVLGGGTAVVVVVALEVGIRTKPYGDPAFGVTDGDAFFQDHGRLAAGVRGDTAKDGGGHPAQSGTLSHRFPEWAPAVAQGDPFVGDVDGIEVAADGCFQPQVTVGDLRRGELSDDARARRNSSSI